MPAEIEAKFLDINLNNLRKQLKESKAKKVHKMVMYKRYVFHLLNNDNGYIRIRQEYNKVTITIKKYKEGSKYADEDEIEISSSFEDAKKFLLAQGYKIKAYQETLREKWSLGECLEIAIDTIPGIPTYVELDCKNEAAIKKVAKLLNLDFSKAKYGAYDQQFIDYYGLKKEEINNAISSLTFKNIDTELKPYIKKNKELLIKVKNNHLKLIKINKIKNI